MTEFSSLHGFLEFQRNVRWKRRYVHNDETQQFLTDVLETSASRLKVLRKGSILFRAQRGFTWTTESHGEENEFDVETAYGEDRMVPKAEFAGDGRANPNKIPALYLATNENTAMAEVRPWIGSRISLSQFKVMRDCRIVDCTLDQKRSWSFEIIDWKTGLRAEEPSAADKEAGVWGDIAHAFSEPVSSDEPSSDYIPTQVLAEAFRSRGYDGIMYKSLLDERGMNIALFDVAAAEPINFCLYQTRRISFDFDQIENRRFVTKYYPQLLRSAGKRDTSDD